MTDADSEHNDPPPQPPKGVFIDYPARGVIRLRVRPGFGTLTLLALPRTLLTLLSVALVVEGFRHHVYVVFWFFGLPFLRWLFGSAQTSITIGERNLEVSQAGLLGGTRSVPRTAIQGFELGRANLLRAFQPALLANTQDNQKIWLLVGLSPEQAQFIQAGLVQWLENE